VDVPFRLDGPAGAPVLVLSNSIGSTSAMWDPQLPALSEHFRVVRYETRGHAGAPLPEGPYTIADLGGDVVALLDRLGVGRAHFAGLSLGGMTGMWLGVNAPERIGRLTLMCTSAMLARDVDWPARAALVR
jgi:pimeloyl-ACP methyl ester carboxylesterase